MQADIADVLCLPRVWNSGADPRLGDPFKLPDPKRGIIPRLRNGRPCEEVLLLVRPA